MVQAMDVSAEVERRTDVLLNERYRLQRTRKNVSVLTNTGISLIAYGANFVALVWCAYRMLLGQMSFGSLTAVIQLVNQLQQFILLGIFRQTIYFGIKSNFMARFFFIAYIYLRCRIFPY